MNTKLPSNVCPFRPPSFIRFVLSPIPLSFFFIPSLPSMISLLSLLYVCWSFFRTVSRNYDWSKANLDPNTHRFGKVLKNDEESVARALKNEVITETTIVDKKVEESRNFYHDPLGKGKNKKFVLRSFIPSFPRLTFPLSLPASFL
jgi:hypothetical protein